MAEGPDPVSYTHLRAAPCRGIELIVGFCGFALCVQRQAQQVVRLSIRVAQIAGVLDIERPAKQRFSLQIKPVAVAVFAQRDQRRQMFGIAPQRFLEIDVRTNLAVPDVYKRQSMESR